MTELLGSMYGGETVRLKEEAAEEAEWFLLPQDWRIGREQRTAFAIDAEHSLDKDDAISVETHADGSATLRVSIADVASHMSLYPSMVALAQRFGWSLYRGSRVSSPMFPPQVSEDKLSLHNGLERPAITFHLPIAADGRLGMPDIALDNLTARTMSYDEVDALADPTLEHPDVTAVRELETVARKLYKARTGSADFNLTDEEGRHMQLLNNSGVGQLIVQESMIAASTAMAHFMIANDIPGIYRTHSLTDEQTNELGGASDLAADEENELARTAARARYSSIPAPHIALGLPVYMHITSPLRRFVDFVNQANIIAYLTQSEPHFSTRQIDYLCGRFNRLESERRANQQTVPSALAGLEHIRSKRQQARHTGARLLTLLEKIQNGTAHQGDIALSLFADLEGDEEDIRDIREAAANFVATRIHFGRGVLQTAAAQNLITLRNAKALPGDVTIIETRDGQQFNYTRKRSPIIDNRAAAAVLARIAGVSVTLPTHEELALANAYATFMGFTRRNGLKCWTHSVAQPEAEPEDRYATTVGVRLGKRSEQRHERTAFGPTKNASERAAAAQLIIDLDLLKWTPEKELSKVAIPENKNPVVILKRYTDKLHATLSYDSETVSDNPFSFRATARAVLPDGSERHMQGDEHPNKKAAQHDAAARLFELLKTEERGLADPQIT